MPGHLWGRDYVADIFELKNRDVKRRASKDDHIVCIARTCGKKPRKGDMRYMPSSTTSNTNKIIGHVECIDRECAAYTAGNKTAKTSIAAHSIATMVNSIKPARGKYEAAIPVAPIDALAALSSTELLTRIQNGIEAADVDDKQKAYEQGFHDALAKVAALLQERGIDI